MVDREPSGLELDPPTKKGRRPVAVPSPEQPEWRRNVAAAQRDFVDFPWYASALLLLLEASIVVLALTSWVQRQPFTSHLQLAAWGYGVAAVAFLLGLGMVGGGEDDGTEAAAPPPVPRTETLEERQEREEREERRRRRLRRRGGGGSEAAAGLGFVVGFVALISLHGLNIILWERARPLIRWWLVLPVVCGTLIYAEHRTRRDSHEQKTAAMLAHIREERARANAPKPAKPPRAPKQGPSCSDHFYGTMPQRD
jgi:hypothetical protein